jgi:4-amino-4-deoxy-L-arabinose transferase-like glycosyltransferase
MPLYHKGVSKSKGFTYVIIQKSRFINPIRLKCVVKNYSIKYLAMTDARSTVLRKITLTQSRGWNWVLFTLILSLAAFFRYINLRTNPGWYADEGNFIDFASNLANGRWEMFGIINAPMLIQRPPLFLYVLSALFRIFGTDILVLRALTATYGVFTILIIYLFVRDAYNEKLALITTGIMAIWPWMVAYNRIGFTYNQLSFFLALTVYAGWKFSNNKNKFWAILACFSAGISVSTDFLGAIAPLYILGLFFLYDRRWLIPSMLISFGVLGIVFLPTYICNPPYFFKDLGGVIQSRGSISILNQIVNIIINEGELIRRETWVIIGLIGLLILPMGKARGMIWFIIGVSLLVIIRTIVPVGRSLHYLIHLFPWFTLGISVFFDKAFQWVYRQFIGTGNSLFNRLNLPNKWIFRDERKTILVKITTNLIIFLILVNPLIWMLFSNVAQSVYGQYFIFSGENNLTLSNEKDVEMVDAFLSHEIHPGDMVAASSQIIWSVPAEQVELSSLLYHDGGIESNLYPIGMERFTFDPSLYKMKYVILDPLAKEFSVRLFAGLVDLVDEVEKWPMVFKSGDIEVYKNPQY